MQLDSTEQVGWAPGGSLAKVLATALPQSGYSATGTWVNLATHPGSEREAFPATLHGEWAGWVMEHPDGSVTLHLVPNQFDSEPSRLEVATKPVRLR